MLDPDQEETQPDLFATLVRALEARRLVEDAFERRERDQEIAELAGIVGAASTPPMRTDDAEVPPRRVGIAMALGLLSSPHLGITLPALQNGTLDPQESARRPTQLLPHIPADAVERALGLGSWELDELRDEVDRRVGVVLKQVRAVNWLWNHFSLPDAERAQRLGRVLVPGLPEGPVDLVWRTSQLYVIADADPFPPAGLFLPWLRPGTGPLMFDARQIDPGLRTGLARGIGASDEEVDDLLERIVTIAPRRGLGAVVEHDQWRSSGFAGVTDLGSAYTRGTGLIEDEPTDGCEWRVWIRADEGQPLSTRYSSERLFDALALPRVGALLRQLHAAMLAGAEHHTSRGVRPEDVDLYDAPHHLRRVLDPLFQWIERPSTHLFVARTTGRPVHEVTQLLDEVRGGWRRHAAARWFALPGAREASMQSLLVRHLVVLHHSLSRTLTTAPDTRAPHADLALLFAAHYLREANLERGWFRPRADDEAPAEDAPDDPLGTWFWRVWRRLLDQSDADRDRRTP